MALAPVGNQRPPTRKEQIRELRGRVRQIAADLQVAIADLAALAETTMRDSVIPQELLKPRLAYRVSEIAEATGLSDQYIYNDINAGRLAAQRRGGVVIVLPADLRDYLERFADLPVEGR